MMDEVNKAWRGPRSCSWDANVRAKALFNLMLWLPLYHAEEGDGVE